LNTLEKVDNSDIGLYSYGSYLLPFLKIGLTRANFNLSGKIPWANYRPISLLTSFTKIVEKVMFNRLVNHLNKCAIINPSQYGLQTNLSTDNAIYALLN
jgi:hypothetical protein